MKPPIKAGDGHVALGTAWAIHIGVTVEVHRSAEAEWPTNSHSNLADRLQKRCKKRIGRPPLPDDELVSKIKAVIAELATYGYRRVHAVRKRQALAAGLKPPITSESTGS